MQTLSKNELVGFVQLQVGSLAVQVPVRSAARSQDEDVSAQPLASFQTEGDACAIVIRGDRTSKAVEKALEGAMNDAVRHLSRKLLN